MCLTSLPDTTTTAFWAIIMIHLQDFIVMHRQGNGTHLMRKPEPTTKYQMLHQLGNKRKRSWFCYICTD
uniref:Uncharacterized protein n=1 Tax=Cannabis sativa TaxID=3483 RepID=A0A803R8C6_CANSA